MDRVIQLTDKQAQMVTVAHAMEQQAREKSALVLEAIVAGSEYADVVNGQYQFDAEKKTLTLIGEPEEE